MQTLKEVAAGSEDEIAPDTTMCELSPAAAEENKPTTVENTRETENMEKQEDGKNEENEESEGLLNDVLETATKIWNEHQQGMKIKACILGSIATSIEYSYSTVYVYRV